MSCLHIAKMMRYLGFICIVEMKTYYQNVWDLNSRSAIKKFTFDKSCEEQWVLVLLKKWTVDRTESSLQEKSSVQKKTSSAMRH